MIPAFDHNGVLPPHLGNPIQRSDMSPYPVTAKEIVTRFGSSKERRQILSGFLQLRNDLRADGLKGFQWVNGSFVQDVETIEKRPPKDIDVVSFVIAPVGFAPAIPLQAWLLPGTAKTTYKVDHYVVDLATHGHALVDHARYWSGLFSHTRMGVWKGMLRVELDPADDDADALKELADLSKNDAAAAAPAVVAPAGGSP